MKDYNKVAMLPVERVLELVIERNRLKMTLVQAVKSDVPISVENAQALLNSLTD